MGWSYRWGLYASFDGRRFRPEPGCALRTAVFGKTELVWVAAFLTVIRYFPR